MSSMYGSPRLDPFAGIKPPTTLNSLADQQMLQNIYKQYPAFQNLYGNNFQLSNVTPDRRKQDRLGWTQDRQSEFYSPQEKGGVDMLPHPALGKYALEYYNQDAINNPEVRRSLTIGEMLHGMNKNPQWEALRQKLFTQFTPEINRQLHGTYKEEGYKGESFPQWVDRTQGDAYLRSGFFENPKSLKGLHPIWYTPEQKAHGDYFNNHEWYSQLSPQQIQTMNAMRQLLQGNH